MNFDRRMACFYAFMTTFFVVSGILGLALNGMTSTQRVAIVALCAPAAGGMGWAAVKLWRFGGRP